MEVLLQRAQVTGKNGEVPVAAVVLDPTGRAIGHGRNRRENQQDPLGHAELVALQQAALVLGSWRLNHCCLIVTLEPCPMCAGALVQARMGTVVYGARDLKRGALGGTMNLSNHTSAYHKMAIDGGLMEVEASSQLKRWFKQRRQRNRRNEAALSQTS
ncbi:nucleoside deaminase [Synechococcus sp. M16CYN]|uniref:nucleoside deaminase n=1 Tax=Synechococcus sp. M16CYN TaxID=3103139 RepID=UPI00334129D2